MTKMLMWWSVAILAAWVLLPRSLESLAYAVGGLAGMVGLGSYELLMLVVGVAAAVAVVSWRDERPGRNYPRRSRQRPKW